MKLHIDPLNDSKSASHLRPQISQPGPTLKLPSILSPDKTLLQNTYLEKLIVSMFQMCNCIGSVAGIDFLSHPSFREQISKMRLIISFFHSPAFSKCVVSLTSIQHSHTVHPARLQTCSSTIH